MRTDFVNPFYLQAFSTSETVGPLVIQFKDFIVTDANTLTSAIRYKDDASSGTDISSVVSISGYTVTISNIWKTSGDAAAVGSYRVCIKTSNPTGSILRECNIFVPII